MGTYTGADAFSNDFYRRNLAAGHKTLVPALVQALKDQNADTVLVVVGGVIPPADYAFLKDAGAAAVFGPGTPLVRSADEVLNVLEKELK